MQKVITVVVYPSSNKGFDYDKGLSEAHHPELNKLLDDGWVIKETLSSVANLGSSSAVVITFILLK